MENITLHNGDSAEVLKQYPDNHFDSVVTDPPYGIEFLGKDWDSNTGAIEVWQECLRVLKPGGYMLAFSAARTYHRLAVNLEDVGFEIKDQIMWLYGSGFPKAQDIGKKSGNDEWAGWKTGLKPAHEPIVMCRKPLDNKVIGEIEGYQKYFYSPKVNRKERHNGLFEDSKDIPIMFAGDEGGGANAVNIRNNITGYSDLDKYGGEEIKTSKDNTLGNNHPTVKPVALMNYLVTLITPPNGKVLDPFNGSGSTGMAVKEFGGEYTGIDLDENYIEISRKRIDAWDNK